MLILMLIALMIPRGMIAAPTLDLAISESVYGAAEKNGIENRIEKSPVAAPQYADPPSSYQRQQLEEQKRQLQQLKLKSLNLQEQNQQEPFPETPEPDKTTEKVIPLISTEFNSKPAATRQSKINLSYQPAATISNHLDDYPPKDRIDPFTSYFNTPNTPHYFSPLRLYRGYPYIYGYPLDMRFGYAYGHAFTTDENFKCPADGRYYRDFGSFYSCEGSSYKVQFCAPGSRNSLPSYDNVAATDDTPFCNVNIVGTHFPLLIPN